MNNTYQTLGPYDIIIIHGQARNVGVQTNYWDNGYEGNYWDNYVGTDTYGDGVGDTYFNIARGNVDNYPLAGMFSSFNTSLGHSVSVISNSTVGQFEHFQSTSTIKMYVSNMTANQTYGFCRVCIPHALIDADNILVTIDDGLTPVLYHNYTLYDNSTHRWIYFAYRHSTHKVNIMPKSMPPSIPLAFIIAMLPAMFVLATLIVAVIYRRRVSK